MAYGFDGLDRITSGQLTSTGGQVQARSFVYDALGHLRTAVNPESGTSSFPE